MATGSQTKYVSTVEVAQVLGVSRRSVTAWLNQGRYKSRRLPGGAFRVEVDADGWPVEAEERD